MIIQNGIHLAHHGAMGIHWGIRRNNMSNYSNNDFRYYKGGEYLAHYGKKGMKWHKHLKAATNWWDENVSGSTAKKEMERAQYNYRTTTWGYKSDGSPTYKQRNKIDSYYSIPKTKRVNLGKQSDGTTLYRDDVVGYKRTNERTIDSKERERYNKQNIEAQKKYDKSLRGKSEKAIKSGAQKVKNLFRKKAVKPAPNIAKKKTVNWYKDTKNYYAKQTRDENKRTAQLLKPQHKKLRSKLANSRKPAYGGNVHSTMLRRKVMNRRRNAKSNINRMIRNNSR